METNLSLFNQINSLSYWFLFETKYKSSVIFNAEQDSFFISLKKKGKSVYTHKINQFSKQNPRIVQFELVAIANCLLHIKESIRQERRTMKAV